MKQSEEAPKTRIADLVATKMEEKGISIKDLAIKMDTTYEHARRIVRGEAVPSKFVLKALCEALSMPYKDVEKIAVADRIEKKYGDVPMEISGKDPELAPIERAWQHLTEEQRRSVVTMVQSWARMNRGSKAS